MKINFKCPDPNCGCDRLEEVMTDVVQSTTIDSIESDGTIEFRKDSATFDGGEVDHYKCTQCGLTPYDVEPENDLPAQNGVEYMPGFTRSPAEAIDSPDDLFDWLLKRNMVSSAKLFVIAKDRAVQWNNMLAAHRQVDAAGEAEVIDQFSVNFGDGWEADIKLVNGDTGPYIDAVLFLGGHEVLALDPSFETINGDYHWEPVDDEDFRFSDFFLRVEIGK